MFYTKLGMLSPIVYPSLANFILMEGKGVVNAPRLARAMSDRKILLPDCFNFDGLKDRFIRIFLKSQKMKEIFSFQILLMNTRNGAIYWTLFAIMTLGNGMME